MSVLGTRLEPVESSNIDAIGFHPELGIVVRFRNGSTYAYPNSTEAEMAEFRNAPSKGRWFHRNLRSRQFRRLA